VLKRIKVYANNNAVWKVWYIADPSSLPNIFVQSMRIMYFDGSGDGL
jgi:hypothetical protein